MSKNKAKKKITKYWISRIKLVDMLAKTVG